MKKPVEFFSSLLAILLNNSFYLYGIYLLAILSIGEDPEATKVYLISTGMILTSWGLLNVFGGGLYDLGKFIETGELESFLAKPRSSLFLVSISKSNLVSLSEIFQGILTLTLVVILYGFTLGIRAFISSLILTLAFAAIVISMGSLSFFSSRGSQLSYVLLNIILTLSLLPVARALRGREKWILYFTPLLMTATLPRLATLTSSQTLFWASCFATFVMFIFSILFFKYGIKRYKSHYFLLGVCE